MLAVDGGQIYLEEVTERELLIHWAGRYAGSPAVAVLHTELAVPLIQRIAPGTLVRWSSGQLIPPNARLVSPADQSRTGGSTLPANRTEP